MDLPRLRPARRLTALVAVALLTTSLASPPVGAVLPGGNGTVYVETDSLMVAYEPGGAIRAVEGPMRLQDLDTASVSPDGRRLLVETDGGIGIMDVEGEQGPQTLIEGFVGSPTWSPTDPDLFAYANGQDSIDLWSLTDGHQGTVVAIDLEAEGFPEDLEWASDGTLYGYGEIFGSNVASLYRVNVAARTHTRVEIANGTFASRIGSASPDATRFAYECEIEGPGYAGGPTNAQRGVCLYDRDGQLIRFVNPLGTAQQLELPVWSPDGQRLAYVYDSEDTLYTSDPAGGNLTSVTDADAFEVTRAILWAPTAAGPPAGEAPLAPGGFDGDPTTTERADFTDPTAYAVAVSAARFGDGDAEVVVLSRDDEFPDSLAGAALTGDGPLLFTSPTSLPAATATEIDRVLAPGGTIYLLGGSAAISAEVEAELAQSGTVERLAGPSRVETSVAVAREVLGAGAFAGDGVRVAVARAGGPADNPTAGWADSVSVGAWTAADRIPTVVTPTDQVHPAVAAFVDEVGVSQTILLGGTAALSADVEAALPNPQRIAGDSRAGTAAAIASQLVGRPDDGTRELVVINGYRPDGWLFGLPAAGLAADAGAPIALGDDPVPPETLALACGPETIDVLLAGGLAVLGDAVATQLDAAPACGA
ncbi:cell wall-binding repeat-containing protein [Euzebya sp.]|uniref:cell wall-binding repeat-containing protein n=1 Tax=Euzebya sp. TaxID=1971409 RepID=UPI003514FE2B